MKNFMSGYTGFVPRSRGIIGMSYPIITHEALNTFSNETYRSKMLSQQPVNLHQEEQKIVNMKQIYPKETGKTVIPKVASFVSKNKSLISSGAKAIGSIAEAGKSISDTVNQSNELKELELIRELRNKRLEERKGKGFKVIG
ncbi:hypothetical protein LOTGIDRAFT_174468 [Lottia gigantea]|uniref:Uncharacterized protein n=1 Tax=Lottia gigantea TaxID=225164 RepID=V4C8G8_LOTGI|nr:hypothetical protein LOTGIDRAFT_174468 [Lottia gigantea]ESO98029.1 hypothetical protein LOTGIDRAFT_174468 [Lottia gigantea]